MKKLISFFLVIALGGALYASESRDTTVNVYGVGAKTDKNQNSSSGMGLMFDSEDVKVKMEGTSDFFKIGGVYKINPFMDNWYFKFGANYLNLKVFSPVNTSTRVNQYSAAFATGYMLRDDFYAELGGSYTKLNGEVFGDYEIKDEKTSLAYIELAKRWETSFGTIDTTANAGEVFYEYKDNEASYGFGIDYYPVDNAKLSYVYQYEKDNTVNSYAAQYSFVFVEYVDNISRDTYQVNAGVKVAFDNLFDVSTWKAPTNIKSHLSELHKFESITFDTNMQLQSTAGVQKTQAAIDRDKIPDPVNHAPQWTQSTYDTGLTIRDDSDAPKTIMDLTSASSDADGDNLTYTIVSVTSPNSNDNIPWSNSLFIQNGILQVKNLVINDPNFDGIVSVVVRVSDGISSSNTTVNFDFLNYQ